MPRRHLATLILLCLALLWQPVQAVRAAKAQAAMLTGLALCSASPSTKQKLPAGELARHHAHDCCQPNTGNGVLPSATIAAPSPISAAAPQALPLSPLVEHPPPQQRARDPPSRVV
ncbi:hypothetical protein [Andreprevotia chitinilytica]|uniref:hypothetical protein n=1 Tax=Andreprevotia chitinilytica TaxID=396808 RepID=UPI000559327B|nr:hypothetical protein [Andreprevotia chitinilytica]